MPTRGAVKKVFPGGNTCKGFYSFYDHIIPEDAVRIFVIKGGPGVGKSSFMKAIAKELVDAGHDVEMHFCSSDNNSLDGVVVPEYGIALIDGTAPHIVDPKNPGAVDEIINLGEYWDEAGMVRNKYEILGCNKEVKKLFNGAYRYLSSAKLMQDDIECMVEEALDRVKFNTLLVSLKDELVNGIEPVAKKARERHLFDSAITPDGLVDYIDTIIPGNYICYYLKGEMSALSTELLSTLGREYVLKGHDVEIYHQPLNPDRLQTLIIDRLKVAVTVNTKKADRAYRVVDLGETLNTEILERRQEFLRIAKELQQLMLDEAVKRVNLAKRMHDEMEKSYIPNMDFEAVTVLRNKILGRIKEIIVQQGE